MATLTAFADESDGWLNSYSTDYATARAGTGSFGGPFATGHNVGQVPAGGGDPYNVYEAFLSFNTSSILDTSTVTAATLSVWGAPDASVTDFTMEARLHDWGTAVETGDYVAGDSLSGKTLLATYSITSWPLSQYNDLTSQGAFASNVSKTGSTRLLLCSNRTTNNNTPTSNEYVGFAAAETAGTSNDPKLVVTYTEQFSQAVTATATSAVDLVRALGYGKILEAISTGVASAGTLFGKILSVQAGSTVAFVRHVGLALAVASGSAAVFNRLITKTLSATALAVATHIVSRFIKQTLTYLQFGPRMSTMPGGVRITITGPDELQFKRGTAIKLHSEFTDKNGTLYDPDAGTIKAQIRKPDATVYTGWNFSDNKTLTKISTGIYEIDFQTSTSDTVGVYKAEVKGTSGTIVAMDDIEFRVKS